MTMRTYDKTRTDKSFNWKRSILTKTIVYDIHTKYQIKICSFNRGNLSAIVIKYF